MTNINLDFNQLVGCMTIEMERIGVILKSL